MTCRLSLILIILVCIMQSCTPKKKVILLSPGDDYYKSEEKKIIYKPASDELNEEASRIITESFSNLSGGSFHKHFQNSAFMCGFSLWRNIRKMIPENDSIGIPAVFMIPDFDPDAAEKFHTAEGRIIRTPPDILRFSELLNLFLGETESVKVRKLTDTEKSVYWAFNSWDIEEPVFIVELGENHILVDMYKKEQEWKILCIEEISQMVANRKKADSIDKDSEAAKKLAREDKYDEAVAKAIKSVEQSEELYGKNSKEYGQELGTLALVYAQKNDMAKAESLFVLTAEVFIAALGPVNAYSANVYSNLGSIYGEQERYQEAEVMLIKSLNILEEIGGKQASALAVNYNSLAILYKDMKEYEKALKYYKKGIKLFEKEFGANSQYTGLGYNNLGEYYFEIEKHEEADKAYRQAESILIQSIGEEDKVTYSIRGNIGRNLVYLKKYNEAEPLLLKVLVFKQQKYGKMDKALLETIESLEKLYTETGDNIKSAEYKKQAEDIKKSGTDKASFIVPIE